MTNEEAIKRLKQVQAEFNENWVDYGGINEAFKKAYQALAERPQGKWITGDKDVTGQYFYDEFICNKCSVVVDNKSNFCPRCGADMRKGEEE